MTAMECGGTAALCIFDYHGIAMIVLVSQIDLAVDWPIHDVTLLLTTRCLLFGEFSRNTSCNSNNIVC